MPFEWRYAGRSTVVRECMLMLIHETTTNNEDTSELQLGNGTRN